MRRIFVPINPYRVLYFGTACGFFTVLAITGWTWPLKAAAALFPVATFLLLT